MNKPKDQTVLSSYEELVNAAAPMQPSEAQELLLDEEDGELFGEEEEELLLDDGEDILFDKAEVIAPDEVDAVVERVTESGSAWPPASLEGSAHASEASPASPSGIMDTVVDDDPKLLEKLVAQQDALAQQQGEELQRRRDAMSSQTPGDSLGVDVDIASYGELSSLQEGIRYVTSSSPSGERLEEASATGGIVIVGEDNARARQASLPPLEADASVRTAVTSREDLMSMPVGEDASTVDEAGHASQVSAAPSDPFSLRPTSSAVGSRDSLSAAGASPSGPRHNAPGPWSSESLVQAKAAQDIGEASAVYHTPSSYETLPIHAMGPSSASLQQPSSMGRQSQEMFEDVIDALSREGIGSREEVREQLRTITSEYYELIRSLSHELDASSQRAIAEGRLMIAEEQEAVWEQLCAHVDLYKDFLYQLLHELNQWRLSDDCCPNLLCRAPRERGHSICRRCQSEFFLICPSCKSQTPFFSERCQQIQCRQEIPAEAKVNAAVSITNAYAQRQGKASVAAAAAFVLYYLMERFSITTKGDWFHQIDRYRKLQGKVNHEYQRRCLATYREELQRILKPVLEQLRHSALHRVVTLVGEGGFLDALDTLNAMHPVLQNNRVEEMRHRIYEKLSEDELNRIESLIQEGKLHEAHRLLQALSFESPRRQQLVERCRQILQEKEQSKSAQRRASAWNVLFLTLLVGGSVLHWMAMPAFLGKHSIGWGAPYVLLWLSGGWLLRKRTVDVQRAQWLLGQTVAAMAVFGGVLVMLLGLLFCSWYLTVPDGAAGLIRPGYRLAPFHANILMAHTSWRIVSHVAVVGGIMGLLAGALVGVVVGTSERERRRILVSALTGALGVSLGVALISAIGIVVGSALSVLVVNTLAAALVVALITALMVSLGVEVGLKIASDMALRNPIWGSVVGAISGAIIGALFGAGVVHNGMNSSMKLIHPDVAWAGLPLAAGLLGAVLFVFVMFRWGGVYLRFLRWSGALFLTAGSLLVYFSG